MTIGDITLDTPGQLIGTNATFTVTGDRTLNLQKANSTFIGGEIVNSTTGRLRAKDALSFGTATIRNSSGGDRRIEGESDNADINFGNAIIAESSFNRFTGERLTIAGGAGGNAFTQEYGSLTTGTGTVLIAADVISAITVGTHRLKFTGTHTLNGDAEFRPRGESVTRAVVDIELSGAISGTGSHSLSVVDVVGGDLGAQRLLLTGSTSNTYTGMTNVRGTGLFGPGDYNGFTISGASLLVVPEPGSAVLLLGGLGLLGLRRRRNS